MTASQIIKASGLKDIEIARAVGCGVPTIWRYRNGKRTPDVEHLPKLARALGCTPADLRPDIAEIFGAGK